LFYTAHNGAWQGLCGSVVESVLAAPKVRSLTWKKRDDIDGDRLGIVGRSYGGYWAGKMAYVESKRIRAAVEWGGPVHYTFQEPWLQHLQEDKLYL